MRAGLATLLPLLWVLSSGAENTTEGEARAPTDVESLMEFFAASGNVRARFWESRHISILTDPVETSGMLYFAPPDRLARHSTRPGRSSVVVNGDRVSFADETGQSSFDMNTSAVARTLVSNLIVVFRGDLESLRARYVISFHREEGKKGSWTLELEPRSRAVRGIIEQVRFTGKGRELATMETLESNGDRTVMTLSNIETDLAWETPELERIFFIGPPNTTP
ncbi:MAG: outer membrane lipoprotein carrier protein LolA [Deltaproteobacteria bacterium]|nr:outer membrane lipoprotein carrier protein LolA [Deltaproteobacteria bacterium]